MVSIHSNILGLICACLEISASTLLPNRLGMNLVSYAHSIEKRKKRSTATSVFRDTVFISMDDPQNTPSTHFTGTVSSVESTSRENCPQQGLFLLFLSHFRPIVSNCNGALKTQIRTQALTCQPGCSSS